MTFKYLMEGPREAERLEMKFSRKEAKKHLKLCDLKKGMNVLDLGCGTGAASRLIAEIVHPGRVVAVDGSPQRLKVAKKIAADEGVSNIEFRQVDFTSPASMRKLPRAAFDVVWSRFVFEYIADPKKVLVNLKPCLRDGGSVVVVDLDGHQGSFMYPIDRDIEVAIASIYEELRRKEFDPFIGRKLFYYFKEAGFDPIEVEIMPYQLIKGRISPTVLKNWDIKFETIWKIMEPKFGDRTETIIQKIRSSFLAENSMSFSLLYIVKGKKVG